MMGSDMGSGSKAGSDSAARRGVAWRLFAWLAGGGILVWVGLLVVTVVMVQYRASSYIGLHELGGEWDGWVGPGWIVGRSYCYGTIEDCAQFDGSPEFEFLPWVSLGLIGIWVVVCFIVSLIVGVIRQRRYRESGSAGTE